MRATTTIHLLGKNGVCSKSGCGLERSHVGRGRDEYSRYCKYHTCTWPGGAGEFSHMCLEKKSDSSQACKSHLKTVREEEGRQAIYWRLRQQQQAQAQWPALCAQEGCAMPRHGRLAICAQHAGICAADNCSQLRMEDTERCFWHQLCLYPECGQPALFICELGALDGGFEFREHTRFCAEHRACDAKMVAKDGSVDECKMPILKGDVVCRDHRCIVVGCKEKREPGLDGRNPRCHHHTCRVTGCKEVTPNSAADRRRRFCETHTCAEPSCHDEVRKGWAFCSRHLSEHMTESASSFNVTDDEARYNDRGHPPTPVMPRRDRHGDQRHSWHAPRPDRHRRRNVDDPDLDRLRTGLRDLGLGKEPSRRHTHRTVRRDHSTTGESSTDDSRSRRFYRARPGEYLDEDSWKRW